MADIIPFPVKFRLTAKAAWVIAVGLFWRVLRWRPWRKERKKPPTIQERFQEQVGEAVKPSEVMQFAKKGCRSCFGKGRLKRLSPDGTAELALCGCGLTKFVRLHKEELIKVQHRLFWKPKVPGASPTRGDATRIAAMIDEGALDPVLHNLGLQASGGKD